MTLTPIAGAFRVSSKFATDAANDDLRENRNVHSLNDPMCFASKQHTFN
jgi:hypothetical protein